MTYKVIGLMSGSSLDGLDIVFTHLTERAGKWHFELKETACYPYSQSWREKLSEAVTLSAEDYLKLHVAYGRYLGEQVLKFIDEKKIELQVDFVASHGHTTFHEPASHLSAQLGDGAAIAAITGLPVISDLRAMDVALGGQGAPIVPVGEKYLFPEEHFFLNIGGIANISFHKADEVIAFDVCPANRVLNSLVEEMELDFDEGGKIASGGVLDEQLLKELNAQEYYHEQYPKSLANAYGLDILIPLINQHPLSQEDKLRTYTEHIAIQVKNAADHLVREFTVPDEDKQLLITGGGALNDFLLLKIKAYLEPMGFKVAVAEKVIIDYKEALIMALVGALRWREQNTVLSSVTGAARDSIGGALWIGHEG